MRSMSLTAFTAAFIPDYQALEIISNLTFNEKNIELYVGQSYRNIIIVNTYSYKQRVVSI